jgi:O-antigen/teichoic acid export membrane protein
MKPIGASAVIGVILSLIVIYIFRPLNSGAVALVVVLCVGAAAILIAIGRAIFGKKR